MMFSTSASLVPFPRGYGICYVTKTSSIVKSIIKIYVIYLHIYICVGYKIMYVGALHCKYFVGNIYVHADLLY